ncbi:hypothetical protein [Streptomyces sp. CC224B]|uniref:hypothetical protein n=1 Tax=Streptomyces sp. CC224B TaxID=3044571 RepID=UPI0024A9471E|nr:hypothetical protein [Streptomyces sp. CC224B]
MTGPEHYRRAESLLEQLRKAHASLTETVKPERAAAVMAEAQVHATLALAAATADHVATVALAHGISGVVVEEWAGVIAAKGGDGS